MRLFDALIQQAGWKTVLYMTWASQRNPEWQQLFRDAYDSH